MGGLASGIYGQMNGYNTKIFEMHNLPGGQCTSWRRRGYTFDVCIHHLFGCNATSRIYQLWAELGAMPREVVCTNECVSVVSPEGKMFNDYYDLERLERHLKELSPTDARVIEDYVKAIKMAAENDFLGESMLGSKWGLIKMLPGILSMFKWFRISMQQFAERFSDSFLRRAFPMLVYSDPSAPLIVHLARHGYGKKGSLAWPVGGALEFARSMERRYVALGGEVLYGQKVDRILTEDDRAVGVRLADGSEHRADFVISNADGRKTIMNLLQGRYADERIKKMCSDPHDVANWTVHVFLGVARDLSKEPSALVMLLDEPVTIAGHENKSIEMQIYGFDKTMAPEGKGVIKVELVSSYSYWKKLYEEKPLYEKEKQKVAETVIDLLEKLYPGIRKQIEVVDVPTMMTWERYMGGTHGFMNFPNKKQSFIQSLLGRGQETTLPGLSDFYFVGAWATSMGALFSNAFSGRQIIKRICQRDGKKFRIT